MTPSFHSATSAAAQSGRSTSARNASAQQGEKAHLHISRARAPRAGPCTFRRLETLVLARTLLAVLLPLEKDFCCRKGEDLMGLTVLQS